MPLMSSGEGAKSMIGLDTGYFLKLLKGDEKPGGYGLPSWMEKRQPSRA